MLFEVSLFVMFENHYSRIFFLINKVFITFNLYPSGFSSDNAFHTEEKDEKSFKA